MSKTTVTYALTDVNNVIKMMDNLTVKGLANISAVQECVKVLSSAKPVSKKATEENKPATMPTISGSAKFLMEVTPRIYTIPMVKSVVTVVFIERPRVLRIPSSTFSANDTPRPMALSFSRIWSKMIMVALIE